MRPATEARAAPFLDGLFTGLVEAEALYRNGAAVPPEEVVFLKSRRPVGLGWFFGAEIQRLPDPAVMTAFGLAAVNERPIGMLMAGFDPIQLGVAKNDAVFVFTAIAIVLPITNFAGMPLA